MAAIDDSHGFPEDALPPEGQFRSREELTAAINDWAAPRGYAFISQRSSKSISGRLTVTFACDRAGIPVATGKGVRKSASRRTGCLFSIIAKESICGTQWHIRHRPDPRSYSHNHAPSSTPMAHPVHRQLSRSDKATVRQMANAGIQPREIRSYLHETSDTLAMQQDIYNCIAQSKRDLAQGQSSIHALAAQLDDDGFWSKIQLDETGRVVAVIFAHPESLEYLKLYPEVLLLDCTYKTNKYKMPLLDIVGVDACQRSFCVAFAFLSGEEEGDFAWALEQLRHIYELHSIALPSVILTDRCLACMNAISSPSCFPESALHLCMWHINKAILTHCQPAFARDKSNTQWQKEWDQFIDMWRKVTESTTEDIFNERLEKWRKQYLPQYLAEVGYIMETWVDPHKEKFVKAWVNRYLHLEQHVTSRAEGIHRLIKSHLKHNQINLFAAWRAIKLVLTNQLHQIKGNQARQEINIPLDISGVLYSNIHGWVSHEALRKIDAQRARLLKDIPACTGVFTISLGLPCAHTLRPLLVQGQPLQLHHLGSHWRLRRSGTPQLIIEPRKLFDRLAASSTLPPSSTRREPSAFEAIERASQPRAPPQCSRCHQYGHRMNAKACPLRYDHLLDPPPQESEPALQPMSTTHTVTYTVTRSISRSVSPGSPSGASIISETITTTHTTTRVISPPAVVPPVVAEAPVLRAGDPRAIFQRYIDSRAAWYATLPRGAPKTNQLYRKAMGLPMRYSKAEYSWCLDYKQMGRYCKDGKVNREWTKEEQMSYLDWDKAESERVERNVEKEMAQQPFSRRRGMQGIWNAAEEDLQIQEQLYQTGNPPH